MENIFGGIATILGIIGAAAYIKDAYHRKTLPHRVAWFIFLILSIISFISQVELGAKASLFYAGWFVINNIIIVSLSLRKNAGYGGIEKGNIAGFTLAIIGIILWQVFSSPLLALLSVLVADSIGALMILIKSYKYPETETITMWCLGIVASIFSMFSVGKLDFALLAYPIYLFVASSLIVVAIIIGKRGLKKNTH